MNIRELIESFSGCPCGKEHRADIKAVEIDSGVKEEAGRILLDNGFPKKILVVTEVFALEASDGIIESLERSGFVVKTKIYSLMREARMEHASEIRELASDVDGIVAVGTGSVDDICRCAAYYEHKEFAIFATAPSMDGFASSIAPITENGFKTSKQTKAPSIIMADTQILAASPSVLKGAGFGDVIGKLVARTDWEISRLVTGEYFCQSIADMILGVVNELIELAPMVPQNDEKAAKRVMEALVLSGLSMTFAGVSRPASGAEHMIAHFWEVKKTEMGEISDYHGRKVGVATLLISEEYLKLAEIKEVFPSAEKIDWKNVERLYGPVLAPEMMKTNSSHITDNIDPNILREKWPEIRMVIRKYIPDVEQLRNTLQIAGAATQISEISVSEELKDLAMEIHPYMRNRVTLSRLRPMLHI